MFGRFKPVPFEPYGHRRRGPRVPAWLWLLGLGVAAGAGGVLWAQEKWLPQRLSASASAQLQASYTQAETERTRLAAELAGTQRTLQAAEAARATLAQQLAGAQASVERLRGDLRSAVAALPPDPRGGRIEVRAGQFSARGSELAYEVVLSRDDGRRPMEAVLQLSLSGDDPRGTDASRTLAPVAFTIGAHEVLRGSLPLPDGLRPRQATVRVLDRPGGQALGMRVLNVRPD
jgi:hypothetical protein